MSHTLNWQTSYEPGEVASHRQKWDCPAWHAAKRLDCDGKKLLNLQALESPGIPGWNRDEISMFLSRCLKAWRTPSGLLLLKRPISFFWLVKPLLRIHFRNKSTLAPFSLASLNRWEPIQRTSWAA